jgi:hypothetical protein
LRQYSGEEEQTQNESEKVGEIGKVPLFPRAFVFDHHGGALHHFKCACLLVRMEISFLIVFQRKTLYIKNEVKEDGSVSVFALV